MKTKAEEIDWNCRFHPTEGWHEVGCHHQNWTKEQLWGALITAKKSHSVLLEELKKHHAKP